MGGDKAAEAPERTGSVRPAAAVAAPTEADLSYAKSAAVDLMARGSKDASQPWESPRTGARGTVTPLATAYDQGGSTCRDFLVSYVREEKQAWYQGGACRRGSQWVVTEMRPLHRT